MRRECFVWLVCGGRFYGNRELVYSTLDGLTMLFGRDIMVMHGACHHGGADILAEDWAKSREMLYVGVPAQWSLYGKKAGFKRNAEMPQLLMPDAVIGFAGGRGTVNMLDIAKRLGVRWVFHYDT